MPALQVRNNHIAEERRQWGGVTLLDFDSIRLPEHLEELSRASNVPRAWRMMWHVEPPEVLPVTLPPRTVRTTELDWFTSHFEELESQYAGQWLAIVDSKVVAHATDVTELWKQISEGGYSRPFLARAGNV